MVIIFPELSVCALSPLHHLIYFVDHAEHAEAFIAGLHSQITEATPANSQVV